MAESERQIVISVRELEALQQERDALKRENSKLANQVDDAQHDFGVIAFCGLNMSKQDKESFRSADAFPALEVLCQEQDAKNMHEFMLSEAKHDNEVLLEYVKAGQYGSGEDVDIHGESRLELFNAVRGLMADAMAGHFLADEVKRLDEREKRFVKHCDALSKLLGLMVHVVPGSFLLEQIEEAAGVLDISAILNRGTDWYHYTEAQVLEMLSKANITESGAAYLLDTHIIDVRLRMEQAYGVHWRDIAVDENE